MNILAIDTATEACSVALLAGDKTFGNRVITPQGHTKVLLDMCTNILTQANLKKIDLDYIACGKGPGSFTGVRIGVGVAQGLSFGLSVKLIPVSNLQILAQGCIRMYECQRIVVAADAKMGEVYLGIFENRNGIAEELTEEVVCSPEKALEIISQFFNEDKWLLTGSGFTAYAEFKFLIDKNNVTLSTDLLPNSLDMLPFAIQHIESAVNPDSVVPTYLRNQVTWKKVNEQHKS